MLLANCATTPLTIIFDLYIILRTRNSLISAPRIFLIIGVIVQSISRALALTFFVACIGRYDWSVACYSLRVWALLEQLRHSFHPDVRPDIVHRAVTPDETQT